MGNSEEEKRSEYKFKKRKRKWWRNILLLFEKDKKDNKGSDGKFWRRKTIQTIWSERQSHLETISEEKKFFRISQLLHQKHKVKVATGIISPWGRLQKPNLQTSKISLHCFSSSLRQQTLFSFSLYYYCASDDACPAPGLPQVLTVTAKQSFLSSSSSSSLIWFYVHTMLIIITPVFDVCVRVKWFKSLWSPLVGVQSLFSHSEAIKLGNKHWQRERSFWIKSGE